MPASVALPRVLAPSCRSSSNQHQKPLFSHKHPTDEIIITFSMICCLLGIPDPFSLVQVLAELPITVGVGIVRNGLATCLDWHLRVVEQEQRYIKNTIRPSVG